MVKATVRYGYMMFISAVPSSLPLRPGDRVIVRTDRGTELGEVVTVPEQIAGTGELTAEPAPQQQPAAPRLAEAGQPAAGTTEAGGETRPGVSDPAPGQAPQRSSYEPRVLRMATGEDVAKARDIRESVEPAQLRFCQQKIRELSVPMRLAAVERLFGGEKIIFYFLAESRVDFRALVRELAREYRTRIEMKQIGARDEAKLLGDYEHCGRELCCRRFIRTLEPVTIRMAKIQKATLDPSKISGACGRLMCCLRFENAIYQQLKRQLPRKGRKVKTPKGEGEVINYDIIAQTVLVEESTGEKVTYKVEELSWSHRERGRARGAGGDQPAGDTLRKSVPREPGETGSSREPGPEATTETRDSDSRRRSRGSRGEPQEGDERA